MGGGGRERGKGQEVCSASWCWHVVDDEFDTFEFVSIQIKHNYGRLQGFTEELTLLKIPY